MTTCTMELQTVLYEKPGHCLSLFGPSSVECTQAKTHTHACTHTHAHMWTCSKSEAARSEVVCTVGEREVAWSDVSCTVRDCEVACSDVSFTVKEREVTWS